MDNVLLSLLERIIFMDVETRELFMKLFDAIERFEINFKTEIAGIKTEIVGIKTEIAGMKKEIAELKVEVAELKVEVAELKVEVAELKVEVTELKAEVAGLKVEVAGLKNEQAKTNERLDALSSLYGFHEVAIQRLKQKMIL